MEKVGNESSQPTADPWLDPFSEAVKKGKSELERHSRRGKPSTHLPSDSLLDNERSPRTRVVGVCTGCKGDVVEHTYWTIPAGADLIIGPGSRNQEVKAIDYHCRDCGLVYRFAPKAKGRRRGKK